MTPASPYQDTIDGGCHWSMLIKRGTTLRLIDQQGGANVGMLLYNPHNYLEKYNAPDTLKCQHTFKLTRGNCLYSDMGRVFCSITQDTCGWHDTVCGNSSKALVHQRWGEKTYQQYRNLWQQNGEEAFLVEIAKYGMNRKDLAANLNLFSKVHVDEHGNLQFDSNHSQAGQSIDLRFEMDTLVVMHTCPHPLNLATEYPRKPITYQLMATPPPDADDLCRNHCDENQRGFQNTELYNNCSQPQAQTPIQGGSL